MESPQDPSPGALDGLLVVNLGWVWAGSMAGQMLADFGATVVRIEWPARHDIIRDVGPTFHGIPGQSFYAHQTYRNQLSCAVDLGTSEGRALVASLAGRADAVIENFSPGTMARLGLDYATLAANHPGLVMLSMSGFGQTGPHRDLPSFGNIVAAAAGFDAANGYPEDGTAVPVNQAITDPLNGILAATLVLGALHRREATGHGDYIDLSQVEQVTDLASVDLLDWQMNARQTGLRGNDDPLLAPNDVFPCRGDDRWVAISVDGNEEWRALVRLMGSPAWTGDYASAFVRAERPRELYERIASWTHDRDATLLAADLQAAGIAAAPVLPPAAVFQDTHLAERGAWATVEHELGPQVIGGVSAKLSRTPGAVRRACPSIGADTAAVLSRYLGLSTAEIATLERSGAIHVHRNRDREGAERGMDESPLP